ncbi:MAG: hypothetical protein ACE1Y4_04560, partial [Lysobacterales bacterium]
VPDRLQSGAKTGIVQYLMKFPRHIALKAGRAWYIDQLNHEVHKTITVNVFNRFFLPVFDLRCSSYPCYLLLLQDDIAVFSYLQ